MQDFVARYGLLAVFLGTAVEGDLPLVLGGVCAHLGLLSPLGTVIAGALGGFAGDATWFAVGRRSAEALRRSAVYRRVGPVVERLAARLGPKQILVARPVYGTRVASMLFWGTQRLPPARFATFDLPAATLWAVLLVSLGYFSSYSVEGLLGRVRHVEEWVAGAAVAAIVVGIALRAVRRRFAAAPR